jgi:hypothetical protein
MKRFSENGARPVRALGGFKTQPIGRLGALVFQPDNTERLYWASLWAPTRIAGCALGLCARLAPAGKTFARNPLRPSRQSRVMVAGGKSPSAFSLALPKEKAWQKERLVVGGSPVFDIIMKKK